MYVAPPPKLLGGGGLAPTPPVPTPMSSQFDQILPFSLHRFITVTMPGRVAQSVGHLTRKSEVLGSIPGLATYFRFSFRFFKKGSCQLLAKVCARSTG